MGARSYSAAAGQKFGPVSTAYEMSVTTYNQQSESLLSGSVPKPMCDSSAMLVLTLAPQKGLLCMWNKSQGRRYWANTWYNQQG